MFLVYGTDSVVSKLQGGRQINCISFLDWARRDLSNVQSVEAESKANPAPYSMDTRDLFSGAAVA
jgi:hypothetical protein